MTLTRVVCFQLATEDKLNILQKGKIIDKSQLQYLKGPFRISLPEAG